MISVDEFGNRRAPMSGGKSAIKASEHQASRKRRAEDIHRDRRARVLLTREWRTA